MTIELDKGLRAALSRRLAAYLADECEVEIAGMDAQLLLDFIAETIGPHFYNQGLYDARALLQAKLEAFGDAFYELEKPVKA